ncbi:DUF4871 domain-containing protein [Fictibacillus sp. NPDC058756]|uniref:DUF4871 domain-containing protein n=1 Tax=Fictibacillus sp. NPDC058756 TaxID=3346625 RepID=UPI0036985961
MKLKYLIIFCLALYLIGCSSDNKVKDFTLPNDIPNFVKENDLKGIDWEQKATFFSTETGTKILGNKMKLGLLGPEFKVNTEGKWMWHFWGVQNGDVTVVGYNKDNSIKPVFYDVESKDFFWTKDGIMGEVNGADAHLPSNMLFEKSGKWALLVYINNELFDTLILELK